MIIAKDDEQYDEGGMVAGMEQDFENLLAEKDKRISDLENEVDMLRDENTRMRKILAVGIKTELKSLLN